MNIIGENINRRTTVSLLQGRTHLPLGLRYAAPMTMKIEVGRTDGPRDSFERTRF